MAEQSDRCGVTWENPRLGSNEHSNCCFRETWREYDRCIWHTEIAEDVDKPVQELRASRETPENRRLSDDNGFAELLQSSRLAGIGFGEQLSFENCFLPSVNLPDARLQNATLTDVSLKDADLTRADLLDAHLTGADLRGASLTDADLRRADLDDADLSGGVKNGGAHLTDAFLQNANLIHADLAYANLIRAGLAHADLTDADLRDADLTGANARDADLIDASLQRVDLTDADLEDADLNNASLQDADLTDADLEDADLTGTNLTGADFSGTRLPKATLHGQNLEERDFSEQNLRNADLSDTRLDDTDLTGANLELADLSGASLTGVDLSGATLEGADLTDADLQDADLPDAFLRGANLTDASLRATDLTDADFEDATLTRATLWGANASEATFEDANCADARLEDGNFTDATLQNADLTDANARNCVFDGANLQNTLLVRTDCRDADFSDALLYDTVFSNSRINSQTRFADRQATDTDTLTQRPNCIYETDETTADRLPDDTTPLEAAQWTYGRLATLHENNALSERARQFHVSKEEAEREQYDRADNPRYYVKTVMWHLTGHGESVKRTLKWWAWVIATAAVLLPYTGGVENANGTRHAISVTELGSRTAGGMVQDLLINAYFSVITFSTIGYGDLAPAGPISRAIVAVESVLGALLVALLIFVLGRRVSR